MSTPSDIEAPTENSPLIASSLEVSPSIQSVSSTGSSTDATASTAGEDDAAKELEKPWPATFERSMMILAGPIMDEKSIDTYTKSPSVRNRYLKKNQKQGYFTPHASTMPTTPGTPAWLKKGLVRLKSLDYRFSDDNTAVYPGGKKFKAVKSGQKIDSHAYRMEILKKTGSSAGLRSSASNLQDTDVGGVRGKKQSPQLKREDDDVTKSPGYKREKQIEIQRKKEKRKEEEKEKKGGKKDGGGHGHGHGGGGDENKSTFWQCVFNMANILMGVGMLGLPYVFRSAGWIGGFFTVLGLCLVTWRTSYYLGRELNGDPRPVHLFENVAMKSPIGVNGGDAKSNNDTSGATTITRMRKPIASFPGIAREAFGDNGCICLSSVLYFELFSCLSIFFVSLGDHLYLLFPSLSQSKHMTIVAGVLIIPSALLRTPKLLSYLSAVGTCATVAVVLSVVLSALVMFLMATKGEDSTQQSGAEREYILYSSNGLPLALGIVAYCFSGHAIVPSIYSSMARPQDFERMIDLTYGVVLVCCFLVAVSGYYMFGDDVEDQITISLEEESTNASTLMAMLTWLMILTAMSKFTLTMFPLALGFEEMLTSALPSDLAMELVDSLVKIVLIFLALAVAIFFPSFSFLCSLVGLICTMIVSVIFPALAHLKLFGSKLSLADKVCDVLLVVGGGAVAIVGTIATLREDA